MKVVELTLATSFVVFDGSGGSPVSIPRGGGGDDSSYQVGGQ